MQCQNTKEIEKYEKIAVSCCNRITMDVCSSEDTHTQLACI
jgi:hypothetical protein